MKKLLIALLVLAAAAVPAVEAGNRCKTKMCKKEKVCAPKTKTFKPACAPSCTETTTLDHSYFIPCMVPGKKEVKCYKTVRNCVNTSECCEEVPCEEAVCLEDDEEIVNGRVEKK